MGLKYYGLTKQQIKDTRIQFLSGEISFNEAMSLLANVYASNKTLRG